MNSKNRRIVIANTITLVIMLAANFVAGSGIFITTTVADVSHKYDTLFAPAGYAFIIWSFLFILAIAFVGFEWVLVKKGDPNGYINRTGCWFALSNVANTVWLYCWINEQLAWSVLIILLLLYTLCMLTVRLRAELDDEPVRTILFVWWPISFYLGWIMVASIACIAAWLVSKGWHGGAVGEEAWTIIMIAIASALYVLIVITRNLREAASVGIWAFIAIAVKQWHAHNNIGVAAVIASIVLFIVVTVHAIKNSRYNPIAKVKRGEWN
jgi:hypothetical protein